MSKKLRIDVETYSPVDLKKCGAAVYFAHPDFQIMLFSYKYIVNGIAGPTIAVDLMGGDPMPEQVMRDLTDPTVTKTAFNAAFEIGACNAEWKLDLDPAQWQCTMVHALACGMPGSLDGVGKVLNLNVQKDFRGWALIRFFCMPCKPTKKNGMRTRNFPHHDPDRWALFVQYNKTDVDVEHEAATRLECVPMLEFEHRYWVMDMRMNQRGVRVDMPLVDEAIRIDAIVKERLTNKIIGLTGISNPSSVKQLKKWMEEEIDEEVLALNKTTVPDYIERLDGSIVAKVLGIREQLAKASVSKYHAMKRAANADGYVRGLTQFIGAGRTGRAAGRLVQLQNLRKNLMAIGYIPLGGTKDDWVEFDEIVAARELVRSGNWECAELIWEDMLDLLSQLVRTALLPDEGCVFTPVDFSAIEARWLAWASGCKWRLDVFNSHGMIYEASAAQMFKVAMDSIIKLVGKEKIKGPNFSMRAKGKIAELALGYQGGVGALLRMGALKMGLTEEELDPIKEAWRAANLEIAGVSYRGQAPGLWEQMNEAAIRCMALGTPQELVKGMRWRRAHGILFLRLPSGRELCYCKPTLADGDYGPEVRFWGQNQMTKQWEQQKLYGGRIVENADQANCRDLLYHKLGRLEDMGLHHAVRFHVHDEAVPSFRVEEAGDNLKRVQDVFAEEVSWAPGLPLRGDGFITPFFRKDD